MNKLRMVAAIGVAVTVHLVCILVSAYALAQPAPAAQSEADRDAENDAAWSAGYKAGTRGPAEVALIDQAVLRIKAGYVFIPKAEGMRVMRAIGNRVSEKKFVGLVVGTNPDDNWIVVANHIRDGYIKDDDAKSWNADELLQGLKNGTEEGNKERAARGFSEIEVLGWAERPAYDAATHRLVWSVLTKAKNEPDSIDGGVNYNTYALGRDGYFSLNLLTRSGRIDKDKAAAHELLADLSYNPGKRYEDFQAGTDHLAEYGIAALVGGLVAKKLGLLAVIAAFAAKFAKVIAVAVFAFGAGMLKFLFGRKSSGSKPDVSA